MLLALLLAVVCGLAGYVFISHRNRIRAGLKPACSVSRAHLTCDSGDMMNGLNSVVAVITFTRSVRFEDFRAKFVSTIIDRECVFRRKMVFVSGCMYWQSVGPEWNPVDNMSVLKHRVKEHDLQALASKLLSEAVPLESPCWNVVFVEDLALETGAEMASAVLFRYHHALADGFTMIQKMISKMRPVDGSVETAKLFPVPRESSVVPKGLSLMRSFLRGASEILKLSPDAAGIFRGISARQPNEKINVAFAANLSVEEVKQIAHAASAQLAVGRISVNDVITAIVTLALRAHHMRTAPSVIPKDITTVVWVSLKKSFDFSDSASNVKWDNDSLGFAYCQLPLSSESANECLELCHTRLSALKSSAQPLVINSALKLIGALPVNVGKAISAKTADIASVSMSNLPGPSCPVYWPVGGQDEDTSKIGLVASVHFATSPPFHFGPLLSVISYCGTFYVSVSARDELLSQSDLEWITGPGMREAADQLLASSIHR